MIRGVYVTGTDTGIGKTFVAVALLRALRARGLHAIGMKPVASGCSFVDGKWCNDDAQALMGASSDAPVYEDVNPFALPLATAPEIAAADAGIELSLAPIREAFDRLASHGDFVVVEGVGGWAAPLSARLDQMDLVDALELPVVLVVGLRLGCINHARLTLDALRAAKVDVRGWIANTIDPALEHGEATLSILRTRLGPTPCLGVLAHGPHDTATLDISPLM